MAGDNPAESLAGGDATAGGSQTAGGEAGEIGAGGYPEDRTGGEAAVGSRSDGFPAMGRSGDKAVENRGGGEAGEGRSGGFPAVGRGDGETATGNGTATGTGTHDTGYGYDAFISYDHADAEWVRVLAGNLRNAGLRVFFDEWRMAGGDSLVSALDDGLARTAAGVLVVSGESLRRPWVRAEYEAMMTRAVHGEIRLVPVLLGDAPLPPLAARLLWVDFRYADAPDTYRERFGELLRALRLAPVAPPVGDGTGTDDADEADNADAIGAADGTVVLPAAVRRRPEGPTDATLRVTAGEVGFVAAGGREVTHTPAGPSHRLHDALWNVSQARRRRSQVNRDTAGAAAGPVTLTRHDRPGPGGLLAVLVGDRETDGPGSHNRYSFPIPYAMYMQR